VYSESLDEYPKRGAREQSTYQLRAGYLWQYFGELICLGLNIVRLIRIPATAITSMDRLATTAGRAGPARPTRFNADMSGAVALIGVFSMSSMACTVAAGLTDLILDILVNP
jgi:hypothetical protein